MSSDLRAADLAGCLSRGYELQNLTVRVALCSERVQTVMAGFRDIQLLDWQSPAGRAYRNAVALQETALGRAGRRLEDAQLAVGRHAREVALSGGNAPGRY